MDSYYIYVKVLLKQQPQNAWPKRCVATRPIHMAYIEQMMLAS